jgi:nucleoside-diphosphate-sugar epimerase
MDVVGHGFIAGHLRPIAHRHPGVVVIAAGVSSTSAQSPTEFDRERDLVLRVLGQCRRAGHAVVFLSTASHAMYGDTPVPVFEDAPVTPEMPYGKHKRGLELTVMESGVDWLVLRLGHVVGPNQPAHQLLPALIAQLRSGPVQVHTGAHRDLLDVADLRGGIDALLDLGVRNEIVHMASGTAYPVPTIVAGIERRLGVRAAWRVVPGPVTRTLVSTEKLRGFAPDIVAGIGGPDYLERLLDRHIPSYGQVKTG